MKNLNKYFKKSNTISIEKFVDNVLYDKKYGYYNTKKTFGKKGDFVTSPSISFLFGEMIAIWILSLWEQLGKPKNFNIVELGPGDGRLCNVLIHTLKKFPKFYDSLNIYLYEKSIILKKIQKNNIEEKKIIWIKDSKEIKKGPVIFLGNEFLDAVPIKQFKRKKNVLYEKFLQINNKSSIKSIFKKASAADIKQVNKFKNFKNAKFIEYPKKGIKELNWMIKKIKDQGGGVLLIDYGYLNNNNKNTLQSVKSHKKNDIFNNVGDADITSLVNFGLLKNYFYEKKIKVSKVVSQSFFLKKLGILNRAEIISKNMSFREKSKLYFRLQRLLDSRYMGELFKVIFAYKSKKKITLGFN